MRYKESLDIKVIRFLLIVRPAIIMIITMKNILAIFFGLNNETEITLKE